MNIQISRAIFVRLGLGHPGSCWSGQGWGCGVFVGAGLHLRGLWGHQLLTLATSSFTMARPHKLKYTREGKQRSRRSA